MTPTWVAALALLVANDHWLKGSGLLPDLMTGKLSDFAGMLVAPVLLATLLRVRSREALLACHVAVGAVFAGIQLSAGFAGQWSALMGALGHPWVITCDPTDLIALPFLLLSWKLLVPQMDAALPALVPMQRTAVAALSVLGLWSTVATSEGGDWGIDPDGEWYEDVFGNVYVNNANDFDISLHVRPLRDDVLIDCDHVSADPGRLLGEQAFGEAEHWVLPGRTNVGIDMPSSEGGQCSAVWIAGEGIEPRILFVGSVSEHPGRWWSGQTFTPESLDSAGVQIQFDADGRSTWLGDGMILFTPKTDAPEQPASCEAPADEARIDWPLSIPDDARVLAVEPGADGCFELQLQELYLAGDEPTNQGTPYAFYLCAPAAGVPFAADEVLRFEETWGGLGSRELRVTLLDPVSLDPRVAESGQAVRVVRYLRGGNNPANIGLAISRKLVAVPAVSCPWQVEDSCASVERHVDLAVPGVANYLQPGAAVSFADVGALHTAILSYSRQRAVLDQSCAEGALALSYDIDFVVIDEPLL
ncbi:hypothetical protein DB30_07918 [Enhygromyxa salina]|uniref:Uncharacterized protein n=1 Tax=Enhygromyxa salina TaxID=215803 RepID=A0A0C2D0B0_9BACT|nr:hypothetical protein [Enhygromyxa salina]KIG13587.1 hypothetical protein DB30_07918 [Enhygromyxa salina]